MLRRTGIALMLAAAAMAADKPNLDNEIKELQRDVAQLQEMVKTLQMSMEQRVTAVTAQVQGIGASLEKMSAAVASMQKGIEQVGPAVSAQGGRIQQTTESLNTLHQAMADLTASVNKLQTQLGDVNNAMKAMSAPPVGPPGSEKPAAAADLINNAQGDESGGKPQLALQEYSDFVKFYGDTPMANVAQFKVGYLHFQMKNYPAAVEAFDILAQRYPDSTRVPDALLLKRKSLQAMGKSAEAAAACQELRRKYAASEQAKQCVVARR